MKRKKKNKPLSLEEHLKLAMCVSSHEVDYRNLERLYGVKVDPAKK